MRVVSGRKEAKRSSYVVNWLDGGGENEAVKRERAGGSRAQPSDEL